MEALDQNWPTGQVGYLAILGRPNAGKSTFLNTVLDYKLAAVSSKPQTTRRRWTGICSDQDSQIIFLDTPGIHKPKHALGEVMQHTIRRAIKDADAILCLADPTRPPGEEDQMVAEAAAGSGKKLILAINKTDIASREEIATMRAFYTQRLPGAPVFEICASLLSSQQPLLQALKAAMPKGPFLFPPDTITDAFERQICAEMIREAIMQNLSDEVPHCTAVTIESWEEQGDGCKIQALLHTEREQQKQILIGRNGHMIKRLARQAERELAGIREGRVRLKLYVKVSPDWRQKKGAVHDLI